MLFACIFGLILILIFSWKSGVYGDICEYNNAAHQKNCTPYEFAPFISIKIFNALNDYGAAITALATVAIACFTFTLWCSTKRLSEDSAKQIRVAVRSARAAEKAADAAKLNAQAVIDAERAQIFIDIGEDDVTMAIHDASLGPRSDPRLPLDEQIQQLFSISYSLKNYGKTPAAIQEMGHRVAIQPELPSIRRDSERVIDMPDQILAGGSKTKPPLRILDTPPLTADLARAIIDKNNRFLFFGYVVYEDIFRVERTIEFIWHYDAAGRRFRMLSHTETEKKR